MKVMTYKHVRLCTECEFLVRNCPTCGHENWHCQYTKKRILGGFPSGCLYIVEAGEIELPDLKKEKDDDNRS